MKILHVTKDVWPGGGGVGRHIDGFLREAARHGVEGRVFSGRLPSPALIAEIGWAELVHVHGARTPIAAFAALAARAAGRPFVYTPHCYYDTRRRLALAAKTAWDRSVERALLDAAAATILLAESWRADLDGRGLRPRRAVIVPNCVRYADVEARRPAGNAPKLRGSPALIAVARLDPVKRLDDAVRALALPELASACLHLVGDGPERSALQQLAAAIGVADRVILYGRIDDAEIGRMLAGADLFLVPSRREGMPTSILEALLLGVPVLASDIMGTRDLLSAIGWPALHTSGDPSALAAGVHLWAGRAVPAEVQDRIRAGFTWESQAIRLAALYREILDREIVARPVPGL